MTAPGRLSTSTYGSKLVSVWDSGPSQRSERLLELRRVNVGEPDFQRATIDNDGERVPIADSDDATGKLGAHGANRGKIEGEAK